MSYSQIIWYSLGKKQETALNFECNYNCEKNITAKDWEETIFNNIVFGHLKFLYFQIFL